VQVHSMSSVVSRAGLVFLFLSHAACSIFQAWGAPLYRVSALRNVRASKPPACGSHLPKPALPPRPRGSTDWHAAHTLRPVLGWWLQCGTGHWTHGHIRWELQGPGAPRDGFAGSWLMTARRETLHRAASPANGVRSRHPLSEFVPRGHRTRGPPEGSPLSFLWEPWVSLRLLWELQGPQKPGADPSVARITLGHQPCSAFPRSHPNWQASPQLSGDDDA